MTNQWRYNKQSGGTEFWIRTDSFKNFLINSGYGKQIIKGKFHQIVAPTKENPNGATARLQPGDLIGYIIHGNDIDHFSIFVGYDENGYPLVNSHSTDRFRVPFDLGWDQNTKYLLIHIKD
ncbi:putative amidase domain protein [compost metagenome]